MLGLKAGRLMPDDADCFESAELDTYELVLARVPQERRNTIVQLERQGFRYVGLDMALARARGLAGERTTGAAGWQMRRIRHASPDFEIQGFQIEDSRFMADERCRKCLPSDFWDRVVREHCESFADTVIGAVDARGRLGGFISCLQKPQHLDMFLVAVHPDRQNQGLGGLLVSEAGSLADAWNLPVRTNVMASNTRGFNFYLRHHFLVKDAEVVLHRWRGEGHPVR